MWTTILTLAFVFDLQFGQHVLQVNLTADDTGLRVKTGGVVSDRNVSSNISIVKLTDERLVMHSNFTTDEEYYNIVVQNSEDRAEIVVDSSVFATDPPSPASLSS